MQERDWTDTEGWETEGQKYWKYSLYQQKEILKIFFISIIRKKYWCKYLDQHQHQGVDENWGLSPSIPHIEVKN